MNFKEFLEYKKNMVSPYLRDFSETNLYAYYANKFVVSGEVGEGHKNGNIHRCHLVEDWLSYFSLPQDLKKHIGVSNGVRHSLDLLFEFYKEKKFLLPVDVYPVYLEKANIAAVEYDTFSTLVDGWVDGAIQRSGDILLLTDPLKPLGREISSLEWGLIKSWLDADSKRILIIDAVYNLDNSFKKEIMDLYFNNNVIMLHSLSKAWLLPQRFGVALFPQNKDGNVLRELFKNNEKNDMHLKEAYLALNKFKSNPEFIKEDILKLIDNASSELGIALEQNKQNPSYLFYSKLGHNFWLDKGILTVPESVFGGGGSGSIISVLH